MVRDITCSRWIAICATLVACNFTGSGSERPDGAVNVVTVGFATDTSLVDESSGNVMVPVMLTGSPEGTVNVTYRIGGGTATHPDDYDVTEGTLVFTGAGAQMIALTIKPDALAEPDETIVLELGAPGGVELATSTHTLTISANTLPRVNFSLAASSIVEAATTTMLQLELDTDFAFPVVATYTVSGASATEGVDYTIAAGPVTFAPHETVKFIPLTILQDALDEDPETVTVTLTGVDTAVIGPTPSQTVTLTDDGDPAPTVAFTIDQESSVESTPTVTLTVNLSVPSGKLITVPFTIGGTATDPVDYTYASTAALTFPSLTTSQTITINVVSDTVDEDNETVVTTLGTPTNATLSGALPKVNTFTVQDDDLACFGPTTGPGKVCFDRGPTTAAAPGTTLDTDASALCEAAQPPGWTASGQPAACFIKGTTVAVGAAGTRVTGSRPLVLVSSGTLSITGLLDVSSTGGNAGPASPSGACKAFGGTLENSSGNGAGGGAGGSFMAAGGDGGSGDSGNKNPGTAAAADTQPTLLRGGCTGQKGGTDPGHQPGAAGRGGGVVYLIAGTTLSISSAGGIDASGAGGGAGGLLTGGSGGGSGGMIKLHATTFANNSAAKLMANGGGGSGGASSGSVGFPGGEPNFASSVTTVAVGGGGGGGVGGSGFAGSTNATDGSPGSNNKAGGGGGGGGGFIESNATLNPAKVSAGKIAITP